VSTVVHGLYITVLGMGLVFLTLGAIYLLITLLVKLLPPRTAPAVPHVSAPAPDEPAGGDLEGEKIAAIGIALARALADEPNALAPTGAEVSGRANSWVAAGRTRQLNHPQSREKKS